MGFPQRSHQNIINPFKLFLLLLH